MGKRWGRMIGKFSKSNSLRGLETPLVDGVAKNLPFLLGVRKYLEACPMKKFHFLETTVFRLRGIFWGGGGGWRRFIERG